MLISTTVCVKTNGNTLLDGLEQVLSHPMNHLRLVVDGHISDAELTPYIIIVAIWLNKNVEVQLMDCGNVIESFIFIKE